MEQQRWQRVRSIFDEALDVPENHQASFLNSVCTGDEELRQEVQQLLQHLAQSGGFLYLEDRHGPRTFEAGYIVSGRYRVIAQLGSGGRGEVYEVEDQELREIVALKTIRLDCFDPLQALERLRREVRNARRVAHRNVCRLFDIGFDVEGSAGRAYLTMELVRGEALGKYINRRGGLGEEEALELAKQLCDGLEAAHSQEIIHGDLKGQNIVVTEPERRLAVLDFGLSRFNGIDEKPSSTLSRQVAGTPSHLAPERFEGIPASYASDVYSLGVILHELIANELPPTERDTQGRRKVSSTIPKTWASTIVACLSLNPADRPPGARAVREMLCPAIAQPRRTHRLQWLSYGLAAVLGLAVLWEIGGRERRAGNIETGSARMPGDLQPGAKDLFTTGRAYLNRFTPASTDRAIEAFKRGLAKDPKNAVASAQLAEAFAHKYESTKSPHGSSKRV